MTAYSAWFTLICGVLSLGCVIWNWILVRRNLRALREIKRRMDGRK